MAERRVRAGRVAARGALLVLALVATLLPLGMRPAAAATLPAGFVEETVVNGLDLPSTMAFLPDGRLLVAEKDGLVKIVVDGIVQPTPFIDLRAQVNSYWDRGLAGIAVDPSFATNGFVYLIYPQDPDGTDGSGPVTNRLARVTATGNVASPASLTVVLGTATGAGCPSISSSCMPQDWYGHSVDSLVFAPDGTLFVSMGDASSWDFVDERALRAQDVNQYPGKILRITKSGLGVSSNPFWNGDATAIRSKVYAYGFRNPFRMSLDAASGRLYVGDVGWNTTEEIDTVVAGGNYGWPCYEGAGRTPGYDQLSTCTTLYGAGASAVRQPLFQWPHAAGGGAAVAGPFTPATSSFPSAYHGGFFYADYSLGWIRFARLDAAGNLVGSPESFATDAGAPVDLHFGADGYLYYVEIISGEIRRIRPTGTGTGPSTTYLSDLTPSATPVNGWGPYERDRSNGEMGAGDGTTLRIGGVSYAKGLGVHADSDLRYAVPAGCTTFTANVGVDDEIASPNGSVVFEVWNGTSSRLYQSPTTTGAGSPIPVSVGLTGVTTLRLVVLTTPDGPNSDHGDWADAKLSCGGSGGGPDTFAPVVSNVSSAPSTTSAVVGWTTDEPATSRIEYGTSPTYGSSTPLDTALVTTHSQTLTGLAANSTYHFRIQSRDAAGNTTTTADQAFSTPAAGGGSTTFLSDLTPVGTPVNGWGPYERDTSNGESAAGDGTTLRIGGTSYTKGLGVHAASELRFAVPAGCTTFTADVGIDDEIASPNGSVVFEVWNDSATRLYQSPTKTGADGPTAVSVSLAGVSTLRLVVATTADGPNSDHADWAGARVTCGSSGNAPPVATITSPASTTTFKVGDVIALSGSATDAEDGAVPSSGLQWQVNLKHCPGGVCHTHPYQTSSGATASLTVPDHGDDSFIEVNLTATDSQGATGTATRNVTPQTVQLTLSSSPSGMALVYGDQNVTAPFTATAIVGGTRTVSAPSPQGASTFASWSDGGAQQHNIVVPSVSSTLVATYTTSGTTTTYLSNLTPSATPVNGWGPYERDMSNGEKAAGDGRTLQIGAVTYAKGLGVHAVSDIRYAVPSGCSTFSAQVGVDDEITTKGTVVFEVWSGTATRLYQSPVRDSAQGPLAVSVNLTGVTTLRLVVAATGDGKNNDHADWADAKLTCGGGTPDTTPPVVSNVAATPSSTTAAVTWTTNEPSTSQVDYGTTTSYGSSTTLDGTLDSSHAQTLSSLSPSTLYHYRVRSRDAAGNLTTTGDRTFTTSAAPSGSTTYLSDLTPSATPVNGWGPYERDLSNGETAAGDGTTLRIGGVSYTKGLGVHADSDLRYTVPSGCTTFSAEVGVDDEVGSAGSVVFEVWNGTTTRLYQSATRTGADGATPVSVGLAGVGTLRLVVTTTADGAASDHADWANAALTCSGGGGGTPTFGSAAAFPTSTNAHSVAGGDLNGDGRLDLVTADAGSARVSVLLGNGAGGFGAASGYTTGSEPKAAMLGDLNGDGRLDVVTANQGTSNISVLLGNGNGTLQAKVDYAAAPNSHEVVLHDLNGDGRLDAAVVGWGGSVASVLLGNGNGTFQPKVDHTTGSSPTSIAAADFTGDAVPDLVVANHGAANVAVLRGNGNGTFQPATTIAVGSGPHSVRTGDLNGDGRADIAVACDAANVVSVLLGNGNGTFQPRTDLVTGQTPKGVAIADVNGDGRLDVLTANIRGNYPSLVTPGGDTVSIHLGDGAGAFSPKVDVTVGQAPFTVLPRDLNGDGKVDLVTANWHDHGITVRLQT